MQMTWCGGHEADGMAWCGIMMWDNGADADDVG